MKKHFVTFYSPGTLVAETSVLPVDSWDVEKAMEMAHDIKERYGATPYGFRFHTRERDENDLDSHESDGSKMYFLGGKIETLSEIEARHDPKDSILVGNMKSNGCDKIITNTNSWKWTQPFRNGDTLLDWSPRNQTPDN